MRLSSARVQLIRQHSRIQRIRRWNQVSAGRVRARANFRSDSFMRSTRTSASSAKHSRINSRSDPLASRAARTWIDPGIFVESVVAVRDVEPHLSEIPPKLADCRAALRRGLLSRPRQSCGRRAENSRAHWIRCIPPYPIICPLPSLRIFRSHVASRRDQETQPPASRTRTPRLSHPGAQDRRPTQRR